MPMKVLPNSSNIFKGCSYCMILPHDWSTFVCVFGYFWDNRHQSPGARVNQEHFCNSPMLLLLDMPDLRKRVRKLPGKMLNLMAMIQRAQDPLNPYTGLTLTRHNVTKLEGMIESAYLQSENERARRQSVLKLAENAKSANFSAEAFANEMGVSLEDHPEQEEVHQQLILLMRFVLAYLQLDDFQFEAARETLHRLIFHVTVHPKALKYFPDYINQMKSPERRDFKNPYLGSQELDIVPFPKWYLGELQHLLALCECGRGDWRSCQQAIESYFDLIPRTFQDRQWGFAWAFGHCRQPQASPEIISQE